MVNIIFSITVVIIIIFVYNLIYGAAKALNIIVYLLESLNQFADSLNKVLLDERYYLTARSDVGDYNQSSELFLNKFAEIEKNVRQLRDKSDEVPNYDPETEYDEDYFRNEEWVKGVIQSANEFHLKQEGKIGEFTDAHRALDYIDYYRRQREYAASKAELEMLEIEQVWVGSRDPFRAVKLRRLIREKNEELEAYVPDSIISKESETLSYAGFKRLIYRMRRRSDELVREAEMMGDEIVKSWPKLDPDDYTEEQRGELTYFYLRHGFSLSLSSHDFNYLLEHVRRLPREMIRQSQQLMIRKARTEELFYRYRNPAKAIEKNEEVDKLQEYIRENLPPLPEGIRLAPSDWRVRRW